MPVYNPLLNFLNTVSLKSPENVRKQSFFLQFLHYSSEFREYAESL
jgi:hypothetical protein